MNKKGFTLIELLAVIIVLAIIALIAAPIVLDIIDDSKKSTTLVKADFYLEAVDIALKNSRLEGKKIQDGEYNILSNGNMCLSYKTDNITCKDSLEIEEKGKTPEEGTITIANGEIEGALFTLDNKEITKNSKGELVYIKYLEEVCEYKEGLKGEISSKYECKVDPNKAAYTFYILSYLDKDGNIIMDKENAKSVNLIMDSNIRTGGEPVKEENPTEDQEGLVAWINHGDYESLGGTVLPYDGDVCGYEEGCVGNDKGPITAMNYLEEATKTWTNTNEIKTSKVTDDEGEPYTIAKTYKTNARMAYYSEVESVSPDKVWLINYLVGSDDEDYGIEGRTGVSVYGYWTLSPFAGNSYYAWYVYYGGSMSSSDVGDAYYCGVRPVINLKI